MISGVACIGGSLWFWSRMSAIRREMRPIYERLGIVPVQQAPIEENPLEEGAEA